MATKTATPTDTRVWIGLNGESYCLSHAPYSLSSAIKARPKVGHHVTENNDWISVQPTEAPCETCR